MIIMDDNIKETMEQVRRSKWAKWDWYLYLVYLVAMAIALGLTIFDFLPLAWGATVCLWIIMSRPMLGFLSLTFSTEHSDGGERIELIIVFLLSVLCLMFLIFLYFSSDIGGDRIKVSLFVMVILVASMYRPKPPSSRGLLR